MAWVSVGSQRHAVERLVQETHTGRVPEHCQELEFGVAISFWGRLPLTFVSDKPDRQQTPRSVWDADPRDALAPHPLAQGGLRAEDACQKAYRKT